MENNKTIEIFVSDKCPFCHPVIEDYQNNPEKYEGAEVININESMKNLKRFLRYRDHLEGYKEVIEEGSVGVPSKVTDGNEVEFIDVENL